MPTPSRSDCQLVARAVPVEIAGAAEATPEKPATFKLVAYTGEPMRIYPWDNPVVIDLETVDLSGLPIPALYDHMAYEDAIVGQVDAAGIAEGQLVASGRFTPTGDAMSCGNRVLTRAKAGYQWQASVGGDPASIEEIKAGASVVVNGRTYQGPVTVARGLVLREISFVVLGGDRRTSGVIGRNRRARIRGTGAMTPSFEEYVQSLGFDPAALDDTQMANLKLQYAEAYPEGGGDAGGEGDAPVVPAEEATPQEEEVNAEDAMAPTEPDDDEAVPTNAAAKPPKVKAGAKKPDLAAARAAAAERARCETITTVCLEAGNPKVRPQGQEKTVPLAAHAIKAKWTVAQVKEHLLQAKRNSRPTGPAIISRSHDKDCTIQALQGAILLRHGKRLDHPAFRSVKAMAMGLPAWLRRDLNDAEKNRIMEAAHRYSDMSAVDLCRECLRIEGRQIPHNRSEMIRAAFSTGSSLTNVLTTDVNASLIMSYMDTEDTTAGWVMEEDVADYNTQDRPRLLIGEGLTEQPEGGEAEHTSWSDTSESYKVHRYSRQFEIDEILIVNDRLGAATSDIPSRFGQAAAWLRPDLVYAELMSNPTLSADSVAVFHAASHSNLNTTSALAASTLKTAIAAMFTQQENSRNLNIRATHLLVPPSLKWTGMELLNSGTMFFANAGTTDVAVERGSMNTLQQENLTLVSDSRLENGVTHPQTKVAQSGSATTWYLASTGAPGILVGYLRGTGRAPQVRSGQLDRGKFGMWFDVKHTIGVKFLDYRGWQKSTA